MSETRVCASLTVSKQLQTLYDIIVTTSRRVIVHNGPHRGTLVSRNDVNDLVDFKF